MFFLMICGIRRIEIGSVFGLNTRMQLSFLTRRGLTSSSTVLDLGCGPMRLGSAPGFLAKGRLILWTGHQSQHYRLR